MVGKQTDLEALKASFISVHIFERIIGFLECFEVQLLAANVYKTLAIISLLFLS